MELVFQEAREPAELPQVEQDSHALLNWRRTSKDPFAGQWKRILTWVQANPTRSSGDMLRELQSLFPRRYERSHLRTLQRGMRKIRKHLLQAPEGGGSPEEPRVNLPLPAELKPSRPAPESLGTDHARELVQFALSRYGRPRTAVEADMERRLRAKGLRPSDNYHTGAGG